MVFALEHRRLEGLLAEVAAGDQALGHLSRTGVVPAQGSHRRRQGGLHALFQGADAGGSGGVGHLPVLAAAEVGVGHGGDLALHLVEHEQAVGEHPGPIRGGVLPGLVHRHNRLDPADQFVAPEAKQLAHRRQPRNRRAGEGLQALAQQLEGVALQGLAAAIAPAALGVGTAAGEGPEGVADHEAPAADALAPFH